MKQLLLSVFAFATAVVFAASSPSNVVGSGLGGNSMYATDAYPGFDGLDDLPKVEKKEKSWFLHVSRDTAKEQYAYALDEEAAGNNRSARRAYDALVREWPAAPEAAPAQLRLAKMWENQYKDYDEAFEAYEYLLNFYSRDCAYLELVEHQFKITGLMWEEKKSFLGFSFTSTRVVRQHYESIVRRAPGASYVPEAMMRIAYLREYEGQLEEAAQVYSAIQTRFPATKEAYDAIYKEAVCRMTLCRRLAYNLSRCKDTANYLKLKISQRPDHEKVEEMKGWYSEVTAYLAEYAYTRTKFYDTRMRTSHSAINAYEKYLEEYPDSVHAEEVRTRIGELKAGAKPGLPLEK